MKKVININFQGQVIAIEETAYELLKQYIDSLKKYFSREEGGDEIVNDIESRIAELFGNRSKLGLNCITDEDVLSIISSIGRPEDFDTEYQEADYTYGEKTSDHPASAPEQPKTEPAVNEEQRKLYRNENDKIIAGVCSGLAHYFKTDPVWIRIVFVLLSIMLFWVYLVFWIILKPKALETNVAKRLYRNPNDRFLGGVCSGIAAYFKIETWIPRLLFAAPLLLNLMGMISIPFFPWNRFFPHVDFNWNINISVAVIYAVLWVIIPRATTVKQKLEMMGEE
ncbi:MAG: PspC domain-containing protein, partial [Petrimonas sp.]|uniref:PspC domain-containing protein n=1 Tax=Petrimonas sp. TaxID=2023866 RepID=UPI002B3ACF28|nr:PspC domain-containing protein [Petrimonas sp.]